MSGPSGVAFVTGAGRGIGRATAIELAARGLDVALVSRTAVELEATAARVEALGRRALVLRCDVSCASEVGAATARACEGLGVPRVLVNNAGIVLRAPVHELREQDWDAVLDVNLKGTFLVTRALLPAMRASRRGRIVNVSSISGTLGTAQMSAYCASKWGVIGFTKALAEELRGTGLAALCVLPGSVETRMLAGSGFKAQMQPEDVARTIAWAALDAPEAMQGSSIEMFGP